MSDMKKCKKHDEKLPCKECVREDAERRALNAANRIARNLGF